MARPNTPESGLEPIFKTGLEYSVIARAAEFASEHNNEMADELRLVIVRYLVDQGLIQQAKVITENIQYADQQLLAQICLGGAEGLDSPLWPEIRAQMDEDSDGLLRGNLIEEEYLDTLINTHVKAGNIQEALQIAEDSGLGMYFRSLMRTLVEEGHTDTACGIASSRPNRDELYGCIAGTLADIGQLDGAGRLLRSIAKPPHHDVVKVVRCMQAANDMQGARKLIEDLGKTAAFRIPSTSLKTKLLKFKGGMSPILAAEHVKRALAKGKLKKALKIADSVAAENTGQRFDLIELQIMKYLAAQGDRQAATDRLQGFRENLQLFGRIAIAAAEGPASDLWGNIIKQIESNEEEDDISSEYDLLISEIQRMPVSNEITPATPENLDRLNARQLRLIGASAYRNWQTFIWQQPVTFARLANGAAPVATVFMPKEDQRHFARYLTSQFRSLEPTDPGYRAILRYLSEALVALDDGGNTSQMLRMAQSTRDISAGMRVLKTLLEQRNATAGTAGIDLLCNPDLSGHMRDYLLHKLAATGFIDIDLPSRIEFLEDTEEWPSWASERLIQWLYRDLNVQMDSYMLGWFARKIRGMLPDTLAAVPRDRAQHMLSECLQTIINQSQEAKRRFEDCDESSLLNLLHHSEEDFILYFLLYGGRSAFAAVPSFGSLIFDRASEQAYEIQQKISHQAVHEGLWDTAPKGWYQAMLERRRPDKSLVWQVDVGATLQELQQTACQRIQSVLGKELHWLLAMCANGKLPDNFTNMPQDPPALDPSLAARLQKLLGPTICRAIAGEALPIDPNEFDKVKRKMISQAKQMADLSKLDTTDAAHWRRMAQQLAGNDAFTALQQLIPFLLRQPDMQNSGAIREWCSHVSGMVADLQQAQRIGPDKRQLTLRYLDGKEDFVEMMRFADGAVCCFNTTLRAGEGEDADYQWRMRIARDPHWFVFTIEDTPPDASRRYVSGFVFGSLGYINEEPAILLNGIYMRRKTNAAADAVLEQIVDRFVKPLGVTQVAIATKHGGAFGIDRAKWQNAAGQTMYRPRALANDRHIFDDIGGNVNSPEKMGSHMWMRKLA